MSLVRFPVAPQKERDALAPLSFYGAVCGASFYFAIAKGRPPAYLTPFDERDALAPLSFYGAICGASFYFAVAKGRPPVDLTPAQMVDNMKDLM